MSVCDLVESLGAVSLQVTRDLPVAHIAITRRLIYTHRTFVARAQRFRDLVWQIDPVRFTDEQYDAVRRAIQIGLSALQLQLLAEGADPAIEEIYRDVREAFDDGVELGLHANPAKRLTDEQSRELAGQALLKVVGA